MKPKVSKLFAVTRLTPNKIVRSSLPCDVLKPVRSTQATQPLSCATGGKKGKNKINRTERTKVLPRSPADVLLGAVCCTTLVPPKSTCSLPSASMFRYLFGSWFSTGSFICGTDSPSSTVLIIEEGWVQFFFTSEHAFINDAWSPEEKQITRDQIIILRSCYRNNVTGNKLIA